MPSAARRFVARAVLAALALAGCDVRDERALPPAAGWRTGAATAAGPLLESSVSAAGIEYVEGFDAALRAAAAGRPVLAVFRATWCRWSTELARETLAAPRIVTLARRFVCVAVDADRDAAACRRCGVDAFPTVLLLDAAGSERFRSTGSAAAGLADAMAALLDRAADPGRLATDRRPAAR